jgi:hypothetical protein
MRVLEVDYSDYTGFDTFVHSGTLDRCTGTSNAGGLRTGDQSEGLATSIVGLLSAARLFQMGPLLQN